MIKPSPSDLTATQWPDKFVRGFIRHWLVLLLTPLLIFVSIPFLAPVAMAAGWTGFGEGIYWLYSLFCHQFPQRSWFLFGPKLTYTLDEIHQVYPHTDFWRLRSFYGTPEMGWKVAWSDRMVSLYFYDASLRNGICGSAAVAVHFRPHFLENFVVVPRASDD